MLHQTSHTLIQIPQASGSRAPLHQEALNPAPLRSPSIVSIAPVVYQQALIVGGDAGQEGARGPYLPPQKYYYAAQMQAHQQNPILSNATPINGPPNMYGAPMQQNGSCYISQQQIQMKQEAASAIAMSQHKFQDPVGQTQTIYHQPYYPPDQLQHNTQYIQVASAAYHGFPPANNVSSTTQGSDPAFNISASNVAQKIQEDPSANKIVIHAKLPVDNGHHPVAVDDDILKKRTYSNAFDDPGAQVTISLQNNVSYPQQVVTPPPPVQASNIGPTTIRLNLSVVQQSSMNESGNDIDGSDSGSYNSLSDGESPEDDLASLESPEENDIQYEGEAENFEQNTTSPVQLDTKYYEEPFEPEVNPESTETQLILPPEPKRQKVDSQTPAKTSLTKNFATPVKVDPQSSVLDTIDRGILSAALAFNWSLGRTRHDNRVHFAFEGLRNNYAVNQEGRYISRPPLHQNHNSFLHSNYQPGNTYINAMNQITQVQKEHALMMRKVAEQSRKPQSAQKYAANLARTQTYHRWHEPQKLSRQYDEEHVSYQRASDARPTHYNNCGNSQYVAAKTSNQRTESLTQSQQRQIETLNFFTASRKKPTPPPFMHQRPYSIGGFAYQSMGQQNPFTPPKWGAPQPQDWNGQPANKSNQVFEVTHSANGSGAAAEKQSYKQEPTNLNCEEKGQGSNPRLNEHIENIEDSQDKTTPNLDGRSNQSPDSEFKSEQAFSRGVRQANNGEHASEAQRPYHNEGNSNHYAQGQSRPHMPSLGDFMCVSCGRGPPYTKKYAKNQCQTCYKKTKKRTDGPHYYGSQNGGGDYYSMSQHTFYPKESDNYYAQQHYQESQVSFYNHRPSHPYLNGHPAAQLEAGLPQRSLGYDGEESPAAGNLDDGQEDQDHSARDEPSYQEDAPGLVGGEPHFREPEEVDA